MQKVFAFAGSTSHHVTTSLPVTSERASVQHSSIVATAGSSLNLSCATGTQDIPTWDYVPYSGLETIIYNDGKQSEDLDPRFILDLGGCHRKECSLWIEHMQLKDAGQYICHYSATRYVSLTVTVLGRYKKTQLYLCHRKNSSIIGHHFGRYMSFLLQICET